MKIVRVENGTSSYWLFCLDKIAFFRGNEITVQYRLTGILFCTALTVLQ